MAANLEYKGLLELPVREFHNQDFKPQQFRFESIDTIGENEDGNAVIYGSSGYEYEVELTYEQLCQIIHDSPAL